MLSQERCAFRQSSVSFLIHLTGQDGVKADPEITSPIHDMHGNTLVSGLSRFLCMSPQITELTQPLRELLSVCQMHEPSIGVRNRSKYFGCVTDSFLQPTTSLAPRPCPAVLQRRKAGWGLVERLANYSSAVYDFHESIVRCILFWVKSNALPER